MEDSPTPSPPADAEAAEPARGSLLLLAPSVSISSLGVLGFVAAAFLCWLLGVRGEAREFALFITGGLLLPPLCAAVHWRVIRPDFRRATAGPVETICCWTAIAILLALTSVPILMFVIGGGRDYWKQFGPLGAVRLAAGYGLGVAAAVLVSGGRRALARVLASRATQVVLFVLAFFAACVTLFKIDPSDRYLNLFVRLFFEPPFSDSPAPFGLGRALLLAVIAMASVVALARLETFLIQRRSRGLPAARRIALCATAAITVAVFFDFSLTNDTLHYLTNVAPALHVLHGATPMVDAFSQYGPGPLLMTVLAFQIGPPTFGTAQIAAQIFNLAYYGVWLVCLYRMSRRKLAALLLGFLSIAVFLGTWAHGYGNVNDAPSHLGLRYLPALMMVLALSCLRPPRRHSAFTFVCAFVAGLWSIETLIGTVGVHLAFLGLIGLRDRRLGRIAVDAVRATVPAVAAVLVLTLGTLARSGTLPDFGTYLGYLSTYNMLSYPWALVGSPRFFGWMAMLLAVFLVSSDAWARVFAPAGTKAGLPRPFDTLRVAPSFVDGSTLLTIDPELVERVEGRATSGGPESRGPTAATAGRVTWLNDTDLFHRFVPMAMLLVLQAAYFVARSVDYTLGVALLPFCALAIPASFGFTTAVTAAGGTARLLVAVPFAIGLWSLTFASLSLVRQHYSLLARSCPQPVECSSAPYSLLLHECRDHGRCSPAALARGLIETIHARSALERVGTPRSDYWFDSSGITRDAVSMIGTWAGDEPAVTVLINGGTPADFVATELALMYAGKRPRWPRSLTFSDELVEATVRRIIAAPARLRAGELVLVRRDEASLGPLEAGILERIRREATLCVLPHPSQLINAYRVAGPAGCPSG